MTLSLDRFPDALLRRWPYRSSRHRLVQVALGAIALTLAQPAITSAQWLHQPNLQIARSQVNAFSSQAGRFTARFPQAPQVDIEQEQLEGSPIQIHTFSVAGEEDGFFIAYADLPAGYLKRGPKAVLSQISQQVLKDMGLRPLILTGRDVALDQHPGRQFRFSQFNTTLDAQFYLVGQRMYLLMGGGADREAVDQFVASFKLL